jgi:hypothetical protein
MLFKLVDHYDFELDVIYETNKNIHNQEIECFVCLETSFEDELHPIKLNTSIFYIRDCNCNGYIHKKCLDIWYNTNKKCPICRKHLQD